MKVVLRLAEMDDTVIATFSDWTGKETEYYLTREIFQSLYAQAEQLKRVLVKRDEDRWWNS